MSVTPAVLDVGKNTHPKLCPLTSGPGPEAKDVLLALQGHADRRINRPVGDLAITNLDHDCVDEDGRIHGIERTRLPGLHFLKDLVCDPRDCLLRHRCAIDLREVGTDLTGRQPVRIEREHDLVDPVQAPLAFLHNDRLE